MERQIKRLQSNYRKRKWAQTEKELMVLLDQKVEEAVQELLKKMQNDSTVIPKEE